MKKSFILLCLGAALFTASSSAADMKFFKKSAEKVWSIHPEYFNTKREIPDSIAEGNSAVILMRYINFDADYEKISNYKGDKTFTRRKTLTRVMVKLLDRNAVQDFSQHEFGESERAKVDYYTFMKSDNAFGARIYKPDGTVTDVDLSEAFAVTEGKKDKDKNAVKRKIDIPGLEPGDILDYFYYNEDEVQEFDPSPTSLNLVTRYPILETIIECRFSPRLTVEYRAYNDAPALEKYTDDNNYNCLRLQRYNLPALTDKIMLNKARQLPFYKFYTLNNTSPLRFYPYYQRSGGLNGSLPVGSVYRDISQLLANTKYDHHLPGDVKRIVNAYVKSHPEASKEEIMKIAWTAATYTNITDKKDRVGDYSLAVMFSDLARRQGWADSVGVGFLNSREDVATEKIINWRQPDFGVFADGKFYLENSTLVFPAGELPSSYQGEKGGAYTQRREDLVKFKVPTVFSAQTIPAFKNRMTVKGTVKSDGNNGVDVDYDITFSGITKELTAQFHNVSKWASEIEDYLGIPANKRYKSESFDEVEYKNRLDEKVREFADNYLYGGEEYSIRDIGIKAYGVRPDAPEFRMSMSANMPETIVPAGNDILLSIGRFLGKQNPVSGTDRNRQTDIELFGPTQKYYDIDIAVPEGYVADEASLSAFRTNVNNKLGMFYTEAVLNDDGNICVRVRTKINAAYAPIGAWDDLLKLHDAETAFFDSVLLLKKKSS